MNFSRRTLLAAAGALPFAAAAQSSYPSQTIHLIVPYAAGGGGDALARVLGPKLSEALKQPVVIENRPGASGVIATDAVIKATPDGHTILLHTLALLSVPATFDKPPYDPVKDLAPVVEMIYTPLWLAVSTQRTQARTVKEFVDQVRGEKGKHHYASSAPASTGHLMGFQFNEQNRLDMEHVGYKGGAPATQAVLAGEVTAGFFDMSTLKAHLSGGRIRLLGVSGAARSQQTPDVPTLKEVGLNGFEVNSWAGLFLPRGTPPAVVKTLADTVNRLLQDPEVVSKYGSLGYDIAVKSHEVFVAQVLRERDQTSALVRKTGVKAQ
ncbi:MAG TPA: tripartite tricarboxylate transporter substrate binding protein [Ramlibacter sp.]|nr:tripartite tricarboxylate transporter substrate binding protein [Ramlibacter sp.]